MASPSNAAAERPSSRLRASRRIAGLLLLFLACAPLHLIARLFGRSAWPRRFLSRVAWICGADVQCEGRPASRGTLLLANHVSWLDIPALAGATGCAFVSKAEMRAHPVLRWPKGFSALNRWLCFPKEPSATAAGCCRSSRRCSRPSRRRRKASSSARWQSTMARWRLSSAGALASLASPMSCGCSGARDGFRSSSACSAPSRPIRIARNWLGPRMTRLRRHWLLPVCGRLAYRPRAHDDSSKNISSQKLRLPDERL